MLFSLLPYVIGITALLLPLSHWLYFLPKCFPAINRKSGESQKAPKTLIRFGLPLHISKYLLTPFKLTPFKLTTPAESYGQIKSRKKKCIASSHSFCVGAGLDKLAERENIQGTEVYRKPFKHITLVTLRSLRIKAKCTDSHSFTALHRNNCIKGKEFKKFNTK